MLDAWIQFLPFVFWLIIAVVPSIRLLRRVGLHPALAAVNVIPMLGLVVIVWIVAYASWPKTQGL